MVDNPNVRVAGVLTGRATLTHPRLRKRMQIAASESESKFPGLQDRVLSKCRDAHIYLDEGTCSRFRGGSLLSCRQGSEGVSVL